MSNFDSNNLKAFKSAILKIVRKLFSTFPLIYLLSVFVFPQTALTEKRLTDYLKQVSAFGFSGQILVVEKDKILLKKSYGYANRENLKSNNDKTLFNIASLTKQFTAAAILRLEADGKLKTDDAISKYLENVPNDKSNITIHQLLTHTSGLNRGQDGEKNTSREDTVAKIFKQPLAAKPGEKFIYSNNGYQLLAAVIEKISKQNFTSYLEENLFKPAGLTQTGFYQNANPDNNRIAQSYNEWTKLKSFAEWNKGWNYGSGSIVSNVSDLYKWIRALAKNKILPPAQKEKLFRKFTVTDNKDVAYGYGWFIKNLADGKTLIYHGGDNAGYHSEFRWYVEDKRLIIILANYEILEPDGTAVQKRIIAANINRILNGEKYDQLPKTIILSPMSLAKQTGIYELPDGSNYKIWNDGSGLKIGAEGQDAINALANFDEKSKAKYAVVNELSEFIVRNLTSGETDKIKERLPAEDYENNISFLADEYESFKKRFGAFVSYKIQGSVSFPWDEDNYRTYVRLKFEKGSTDFYLGWNNGKLNDLTTETGRPFPLIMQLAAESENRFIVYDFVKAKLVPIDFDMKNGEMSLTISSEEIKAKKRKQRK